jgi:hypothetical protein
MSGDQQLFAVSIDIKGVSDDLATSRLGQKTVLAPD